MVFTSPYPDVEVADRTIPSFVLADAAARGDRPALVDAVSGATITYAELDQRVRRLAAGFAATGVRKGDVLAILSPNTIAYPVVCLAAMLAGATVTTVNPLYTADEVGKQISDSAARWLVTISPLLPNTAAVASTVEEIFVCDSAEGYRSIADLMVSADDSPPEVAVDPGDVAILPYSSGTTGIPKGVMLTHRNIVTNIAQIDPLLRFGTDETLVAVLPFFHIYGFCVVMNVGLRNGATVVVMPRFDLEQFLSANATHRATRAFVAPPLVLALAKHPLVEKFDLSSLKYVLSGAAPLDPVLAAACADRLDTTMTQGYGMTELSPVSHIIPHEPELIGRAPSPSGSVGVLAPSTSARLVDPETGSDVATGEPGELWIRGPQVMTGYFGRTEDTDATVDAEGWLHTGDIARVDDDGNWFIVDRVKELIKYHGYQVPPAELEAVLLTHPQIADAAVVGVTDADGEEIPKAFVVAADLAAEDVMAYVAERVAPYKKVRVVEFIDAIPKSASGKILRRELRARASRS